MTKRQKRYQRFLRCNLQKQLIQYMFIIMAIFVAMLVMQGKQAQEEIIEEPAIIQQPKVYVTESAPIPEPEVKPFYFDCSLGEDLQDYIRDLCNEYDVPMYLIIGMIDHESGFTEDIISTTNDYGLMQINSINHEMLAEEYGLDDMLDAYQNVKAGIIIISKHYHNNGEDIVKALMCYNCGSYGAKTLWADGIYSTNYSRLVMEKAEIYRQQEQNYLNDNGMV